MESEGGGPRNFEAHEGGGPRSLRLMREHREEDREALRVLLRDILVGELFSLVYVLC